MLHGMCLYELLWMRWLWTLRSWLWLSTVQLGTIQCSLGSRIIERFVIPEWIAFGVVVCSSGVGHVSAVIVLICRIGVVDASRTGQHIRFGTIHTRLGRRRQKGLDRNIDLINRLIHRRHKADGPLACPGKNTVPFARIWDGLWRHKCSPWTSIVSTRLGRCYTTIDWPSGRFDNGLDVLVYCDCINSIIAIINLVLFLDHTDRRFKHACRRLDSGCHLMAVFTNILLRLILDWIGCGCKDLRFSMFRN